MKEFDFVNPWGMESWQAQNVYSTEALVSPMNMNGEVVTESNEIRKIVNAYWASDIQGTPVETVDYNEDVQKTIAYAYFQTQNMSWQKFYVSLYSKEKSNLSTGTTLGSTVQDYSRTKMVCKE